MLPKVFHELETSVFQYLIAWLPHWQLAGQGLKSFPGGENANSSMTPQYAMMLYERGWRPSDPPKNDEDLQRGVSQVLQSMWFVQMTDKDLLTSALMGILLRAVQTRDQSGGVAEPPTLLSALGLVVRNRKNKWCVVDKQYTPGASVIWSVARALVLNPDPETQTQIVGIAARVNEEMSGSGGDNATVVSARLRKLIEDAHALPDPKREDNALGTWRRPSHRVMHKAVAFVADVLVSIQGGPGNKRQQALVRYKWTIGQSWLKHRRLQAVTRNLFLYYMHSNPSYYYCQHRTQGAYTVCKSAELCPSSSCQAQAAARDHLSKVHSCTCGASNAGWQTTADGAVVCSSTCTPRPRPTKSFTLIQAVPWPMATCDETATNTWSSDRDCALFFSHAHVPAAAADELRTKFDEFISTFQAAAADVHASEKGHAASHADTCALVTSEDTFPWKCVGLRHLFGISAKRRERKTDMSLACVYAAEDGPQAATPAPIVDAVDAGTDKLRCYYLRYIAYARHLKEPSSLEEINKIRHGSERDCIEYLRSNPSAEGRALVAESKAFADAVRKRDFDAFKPFVACRAIPLSPSTESNDKRCVTQHLHSEAQIGSNDTGCVASARTTAPYIKCAAKSTESKNVFYGMGKLQSKTQKVRNLRCSQRDGACKPSGIASQLCHATGSAPKCTASPGWTRSSQKFIERLLHQAVTGVGSRPWGATQIEIGNPAVVFMQPTNCAPYFRLAPEGSSYSVASATVGTGQSNTLMNALAQLLVTLAIHHDAPLSLPIQRCGVCTARSSDKPLAPYECASPVENSHEDSLWLPWVQTPKYADVILSDELSAHDSVSFADLQRPLQESITRLDEFCQRMQISQPSAGHTLCRSGRTLYIKPFSFGLSYTGPPLSRTYVNALPATGSTAACEARICQYLHHLKDCSDAAAKRKSKLSVLDYVTAFAARPVLDNDEALRTATESFYWASSYAQSLMSPPPRRAEAKAAAGSATDSVTKPKRVHNTLTTRVEDDRQIAAQRSVTVLQASHATITLDVVVPSLGAKKRADAA